MASSKRKQNHKSSKRATRRVTVAVKRKPANSNGHRTAPQAAAVWPELAAFATIEIHVPGKAAGRGVCGADVPGIPAGDSRLWGAHSERLEAMERLWADLDRAIAMAGDAIPGAIKVCPGCLANLERMRRGNARKAEAWHGKPSEAAA